MPRFLPNRQVMITKVGKEKGDPWVVHLATPSLPATGAVSRANAGTVAVVLDGPIARSNLNWWRCRVGGQNGWIAETGLVPLMLPDETVYVNFSGDGDILRAGPDPTSAGVASLPAGTPLRAFPMNEPAFGYENAFWRVTTVNNLQGWVVLESLRLGYAPNSTVAPVAGGSSLRVLRRQPDLQAAALRSVMDGESFQVTGGPIVNDKEGWWKVRARDNAEGWLTDRELKGIGAQG